MDPSTAVVIEADPDINLLIRTLLQQSGFTVHTADTGPAGVEVVRHCEPGLITTGLSLPGFGGVEAIRQIRTFTAAPLMIVTASDDIRDVEAGLGAGADGYLAKPFRPRVLQAHAKALLHRPAEQRFPRASPEPGVHRAAAPSDIRIHVPFRSTAD